jgi:MoaA/NifB/PqqE/SkfB family radical SAM enzyme
MEKLKAMGVLFGASITVTSQNLTAVTGEATISSLCEKGCKAIVFVEYVPVEKQELALTEEDRRVLAGKVNELRAREKMIMISFPGDEAESGGCLAAGRGFFHISASGNAEPCPFYPYADTNLKNVSLQEALRSPLFRRLKDEGILLREHMGGCVLFDQTEYARVLLAGQ